MFRFPHMSSTKNKYQFIHPPVQAPIIFVLECGTKKALSLLFPVLPQCTVGSGLVLPFTGLLYISEYLMGLLRAKLFIRAQSPGTVGERSMSMYRVCVCSGIDSEE